MAGVHRLPYPSQSVRSVRQRSCLNAICLAGFSLSILILLGAPFHMAAQTGGADLNNESILKMLRGGLSEEVILTSVEHQPGKYSLSVDEMIALRNAGVPEKVIQAMLRKAAAPPPPAAAPLVLADGTLVNLRLRNALSSGTAAQGQTVELEVTHEVKVGDVVVAPVGTFAEGVVSQVRTAKRGNIPGRLEITLRRLRLADGTDASLRTVPKSQSAAKTAAKTAGNVGKAIAFMGLKHGKEQTLDAGKTLTAYIDGSVTLDRVRILAGAAGSVAPPLADPPRAASSSSLNRITITQHPLPVAAPTPAPAPAATPVATSAIEPASTAALAAEPESPPTSQLPAHVVPPASPTGPRKEYYILNVKPPSVTIVSADDMRALADVPLDSEPTYAVTGPTGRYLYVLQNGLFRTSGELAPGLGRLAVVDLDSRRIAKSVQLGWNINKLTLSKDGQYLICVSQGKAVTKQSSEDEQGTVQIFSTTTNESVATVTAGRDGTQLVYTSDLSRLAILSKGKMPAKKGGAAVKPVVTIFTLAQERPLAEIELDWGTAMELSPDEKWVYVLDRGEMTKKATKNGVVHVIDIQAAQLAKTLDAGASPRWSVDANSGALNVIARTSFKDDHGLLIRYRGPEAEPSVPLGRSPLFLRPLEGGAGSYVATYEDLRLIAPSGLVASGTVPLNPKQAPSGTATLGGNIPGETLYLPLKNRLVSTLQNRAGEPTSKVAILDLSGNRVQHVVTTGRGSVKFGKFMGAMALSMAMSMASYYGAYSVAVSTGQPYFFYNVYVFTPAAPNVELAASTDNERVYALNTQTNDITIINTADGKVIDKIAVGGGCKRVALAPGGRFVYSYTSGQFNLIDTGSNAKSVEYRPSSGRLNAVSVLADSKRLALLTTHAAIIWDAEKGTQIGTIEGLHQPGLLVQPTPQPVR